MKAVGEENFICLPLRTCRKFLLRSNVPEQIFRKAMRSRWFGSMLAWILKTKPVIFSSAGSTIRVSVGAGRGEGAMRMKHSSNSFTPKLLTAEPKKTGASSARR